MSSKVLVMSGMILGSLVGGYIPTLFGVSALSYFSLLTSGIGALLGIWLAWRFVS